METQQSISEWADRTFGPVRTNISIAARVAQELAELLTLLAHDDNDPQAAEECADIVIILMRLVQRLQHDLAADIQAKMVVNRKRVWMLDGHGHGQHIEDPRGDNFRFALDSEP
jgi:NTP pyrophosphatase (non-canonical NTP hydrolase)